MRPSRIVTCTSMLCTVIISLPMQIPRNMDKDLQFSDFINRFSCSKDVSSTSFACSALNNLLIFLATCFSLEGLKVFPRA